MAMDQLTTVLADRAPIIASILVVLAAVLVVPQLFEFDNSTIPLMGGEYGSVAKRRKAYISHAKDIYIKGYEKFRDQVFRLTTNDGESYVIPRSSLEELRRMPDDHVSIDKAFDRMNHNKYTGLGQNRAHGKFIIHLVRGDLTHNLNRINPRLTDEVQRSVVDVLGPCKDDTTYVLYPKLLQIVAIVSGNIFLGPELCKREEWIHASINYTVDLFTAIGKLNQWQWWTRPIGARFFIKELQTLKEHRAKALKFLAPIIAERRQWMAEGREMPDDMLQWMLNKSKDFGLDDDNMSICQLNLSLAAIHTTTLTATMTLYDLVIRPDLIEALREEIKTVLAANGGVMTTHAIFEMKLLDSVMKESQRTNPGNLVRFTRYLEKPVTLSNGATIPAGKIIHAPHASIVQDPNYYTDPMTFNPRRFMDLRASAAPDPLAYKNKEQYQFVTVTKDFMAFGYGRHACPGRFFAANEIKLILARMLIEYDIKMPEGLTERYKNIDNGLDAFPDATKELVFKKVKA